MVRNLESCRRVDSKPLKTRCIFAGRCIEPQASRIQSMHYCCGYVVLDQHFVTAVSEDLEVLFEAVARRNKRQLKLGSRYDYQIRQCSLDAGISADSTKYPMFEDKYLLQNVT